MYSYGVVIKYVLFLTHLIRSELLLPLYLSDAELSLESARANSSSFSAVGFQVKEFTIDYTQCEYTAPNTTFSPLPTSDYSFRLNSDDSPPAPTWQFTMNEQEQDVGRQNLCRVQFELPTEMKSPVFMYYKRKTSSFFSLHSLSHYQLTLERVLF